MRPVLNDEQRRMMPQTSYPFSSSNSARYEPSWPVMPVISAFFRGAADGVMGNTSDNAKGVSWRQGWDLTGGGDREAGTIPLVGRSQPGGERRSMAPAEGVELRDVEQLSRRPVRHASVKRQFDARANGVANQSGEFGNRQILAGSHVDRPSPS